MNFQFIELLTQLKTGKFGTMSQIGLLDISDFFKFQTYLKNADPPSRINFEFENILMAEDPQTNILKGVFRHINNKMDKLRE